MSQLKIYNFIELIAIKQDQLEVNSQDKCPNLLQLVNAQEWWSKNAFHSLINGVKLCLTIDTYSLFINNCEIH
jgi:hypothetical protein